MKKALNPYTVEQLYTKCLSIASYYIHSGGKAVLIDPIRDVKSYLKKLKADNT